MKILYVDLYFFWNALADYLLCLAAGRLRSLRLRRGRYCLAALFGALYALAPLFSLPPALTAPAARLGAGLLMGLIAFGGEERPLPCILTLLGVSAAFGGALYALAELSGGGAPRLSFRLLPASFLAIYGLLKLLSRFHSRFQGSPRSEIRLRFLQREVCFSALVDSGNAARDPATGQGLLIASPAALGPLFGALSPLLELPPVELLEALSHDALWAGKLRLIPFRSLGGSGLLPVFRPERLWVDGKLREDLLVAVSREARGEGFDAIV